MSRHAAAVPTSTPTSHSLRKRYRSQQNRRHRRGLPAFASRRGESPVPLQRFSACRSRLIFRSPLKTGTECRAPTEMQAGQRRTERTRLRSAHAGEAAEAFHFGAGGHGAVLLHHGAHLQILLEDLIYFLNGGAAAGGDALAALAVDDVVVAALLIGHRADDGFDLLEHAFIDLGVFGKVGERADFGKHVYELLERAHLADLFELIAKIFESEFFFAELAFELHRSFAVNRCFGAFDERHQVTHAEDAGDDAFGEEAFERVVFFTEADKLYRRAGDFADRESSAAAGVTVELGEDDAGESEALVKFSGGADSILTDHGVGDE